MFESIFEISERARLDGVRAFFVLVALTFAAFAHLDKSCASTPNDAPAPAEPTVAVSTWEPGVDSDKTPKPPLPDWAVAQIDETFSRFQDWKGGDETFVFPTIADVHSTLPELAEPVDWADSKAHIFILKEAAKKFDADVIVDLGDMGLDAGESLDADAAERRMKTQTLLYADAPVPVVFALGNHDRNRSGEKPLESAEFGRRFNGESKRRGLAFQSGPNDDYGFVDFPTKKLRLIVLNSSDDGYYGFSAAQLQFLADALASTPVDYAATVVAHFCIIFEIGGWTNYPDDKAVRGEICKRIFESFVAGTDGEEEGVAWNFSKRGSGALSGAFHGDSHFDNYAQINGVNYAISQGFGGCDPAVVAPGAVQRGVERDKTTLIDVVAVKPTKREVRIFRVGVGGADADRAFSY